MSDGRRAVGDFRDDRVERGGRDLADLGGGRRRRSNVHSAVGRIAYKGGVGGAVVGGGAEAEGGNEGEFTTRGARQLRDHVQTSSVVLVVNEEVGGAGDIAHRAEVASSV